MPTPPFYPDRAGFLGNFGEIRGTIKIVEAIKSAFRGEPIPDIQSQDNDTKLLQQIVLTIMKLEHPHQAEKVSTQANIPLLGFEAPNEVLSYLDAVIRSGTSAEEKSGTVFLMGNTAHCVLNFTEIFKKSQKTSIG